jgi:adenylate cyclase
VSGDPEQEYFANGGVEDIITALSRVKWFFVIARNSSFTYKGRTVDIKQVGRELGVRYVLEGSVRKVGGRIRITGQLIEAETGHHVWADNFDGKLEDVFDLQDNITQSVVGAIEPRLREAELRRSQSKATNNLVAYDYYLHALHYRDKYTDEDNLEALRLLGEAVRCDPRYALANALAAFCHAQRIYQGWSRIRNDEEAKIHRAATLALNETEDDPEVLWRSGFSLAHAGAEIARCVALTDKAVGLNQTSAHGLHFGGWVQVYAGFYESAISRFARARRLSPFDPFAHGCASGTCAALLFLERFGEAVGWGHQALAENPRFAGTHRVLAAALAHLGRQQEAHAVVQRLLSVAPTATISTISKAYRQTPKLHVFTEGLRLAGLPE